MLAPLWCCCCLWLAAASLLQLAAASISVSISDSVVCNCDAHCRLFSAQQLNSSAAASGCDHFPLAATNQPAGSADQSSARLNEVPPAGAAVQATETTTTTTTTTMPNATASCFELAAPLAPPGGKQTNQTNGRPLNSLRLAANWTRAPEQLARAIADPNFESLELNNSKMDFGAWSQTYALLMVRMRRPANLHRLDLSGNELTKLGVTFTGYLEHHLAALVAAGRLLERQGGARAAAQQLAAIWPFSSAELRRRVAASEELRQLASAAGPLLQRLATAAADSTLAPTNPIGAPAALQLAPDGATNPSSAKLSSGADDKPPITQLELQALKFLRQWQSAAGDSSGSTATGSRQLRNWPALADGQLYESVRQLEFGQRNCSAASWPLLMADNLTQQMEFSSQLAALNLAHNKLKWLVNEQFRAAKLLQSIRLDHNQIHFIHQQAFNGLAHLRHLNLQSNKLKNIYLEQFETNSNLQSLNLRANQLSYLRSGVFMNLNKLVHLDLAENQFTILSNSAFVGLKSIEMLNLSSNEFVRMPSNSLLPVGSSLQVLDLSSNPAVRLTEGAFFQLPAVREIYLNNLDQLIGIERGAFWQLNQLVSLKLNGANLLERIHLNSFIGTPNLRSVAHFDCPHLDTPTRKWLESSNWQQQTGDGMSSSSSRGSNQTNANFESTNSSSLAAAEVTSERQPSRQVAPRSPKQPQTPTNAVGLTPLLPPLLLQPLPPPPSPNVANSQQRRKSNMDPEAPEVGSAKQVAEGQQQLWLAQLWKYFYSAGLMASVLLVLKLMFHYTSSEHYNSLDERRRRRRQVYSLCDLPPLDGATVADAAAAAAATCSESTLSVGAASRSIWSNDENCNSAASQFVGSSPLQPVEWHPIERSRSFSSSQLDPMRAGGQLNAATRVVASYSESQLADCQSIGCASAWTKQPEAVILAASEHRKEEEEEDEEDEAGEYSASACELLQCAGCFVVVDPQANCCDESTQIHSDATLAADYLLFASQQPEVAT